MRKLVIALSCSFLVLVLGLLGCAKSPTPANSAKPAAEKPSQEATGSAKVATESADAADGAETPGTTGAPFANVPSKPTAAPTKPAAKGTKLVEIETPPAATAALIDLPKGFDGAAFDAVIQPYGFVQAPPESPIQKMIVKVIKWEPADEGAKAFADFTGRNALLVMDRRFVKEGKTPKVGGRYTVRIQLRPSRGVGQFYVEEIGSGS